MLIFVFSDEAQRDKFEYLYNKYKRLMLHKAYEILRDYSLAEDAVSEAFIRVFKNIDSIDNPDSNMSISFLMTIVKNVSLTMIKKETRWQNEEITDEKESNINIEKSMLDKMAASEIVQIVERLKDDLKSVFLLKYAHEMSHREIANVLGISENNVTVRLHRAKQKLGIMLEKEGYTHE